MELVKKNVHMNNLKCKKRSQLTVEDDINVPDAKPDIDSLITDQSDIKIDSVKVHDGKINVRGMLAFGVLYSNQGDGRHIHNLTGEMPFDETINVDEIEEGDSINLKWDIDDLKVDLINSRKLSVKAIVTFDVVVELLQDVETTTEIIDDSNVQTTKSNMNVVEIAVNKKDIYRIKDELDLPKNKSNIDKIVWNNVSLQGVETKLMDDKVSVSGQLLVFTMYQPTDENSPMQWMENIMPFHGMLDVSGCNDQMIPNIGIKLNTIEVEPKADADGELRVIDIDAVLDLDIKLYIESEINILRDLYSTQAQLTPVTKNCRYEELLIKNCSKTKVVDKLKVDTNLGHIMQICSTTGNVKLDDVTIVEDGIEVEGIINIVIMYISNDDKCPLKCMRSVVPFNQKIEVDGIDENCIYFLRQCLESLNATMVSTEEVEIKALIAIDALVFRTMHRKIITDVNKEELDITNLEELPGIVGYLVQKGDTLWKIAKENYTTVENIMEINDLQSSKLNVGEKIIIVKQAGVVVN